MLHEELMAVHEELTASEEELRQQCDELMAANEKIHRQNMILTSLHETALSLMDRLDLDGVLRMILSGATELIGTAHGFVNLVDEEEGVAFRKVAAGKFAQDMEGLTKVTEGLLGQAYKTGQIAVVNDYSTWEHRVHSPIYDGFRCSVVVPLKDGDRMIGALGLAFSEPGRTLADYETFLLQRFGDLASIALNNATLVTSLKLTNTASSFKR